jgi:pimeloyl-ACP methyl ester carboxylesterase
MCYYFGKFGSPALGGDYPGNFAYSSLQSLASNVTGITVPLSGHWIPEEQPKFVVDQLFKFFGSNTTKGK